MEVLRNLKPDFKKYWSVIFYTCFNYMTTVLPDKYLARCALKNRWDALVTGKTAIWIFMLLMFLKLCVALLG